MNKHLRDFKLIALLAVAWLVSGVVMGLGLRAQFGVDWVNKSTRGI